MKLVLLCQLDTSTHIKGVFVHVYSDLDPNSSKVSGFTIWMGDGRNIEKKNGTPTIVMVNATRNVNAVSSLWVGFYEKVF